MDLREELELFIERVGYSDIRYDDIKEKFSENTDIEIVRTLFEMLESELKIDTSYSRLNCLLSLIISSYVDLNEKEEKELLSKLNKLQVKIKTIVKNMDRKNTPDIIKRRIDDAKKRLQTFIDDINYKMSIEDKLYDYFWYIINDIRALELFRKLVQEQNKFLYIGNDVLNKIFLSTAYAYLENYDTYYLDVMALVLENMESLTDLKGVEGIYNTLEEMENISVADIQSINLLKQVLSHYIIPDTDPFSLTNSNIEKSKTQPVEKSNYGEILDWIDYEGRTDFILKPTFAIKSDDSDIVTTAYSIEEDGEDVVIYYHIADIASFIKGESSMDLNASRVGNKKNIIDSNYLERFISLKQGLDRLTITVKVVLDKYLNIKSTDVMDSVVRLNAIVSKDDILNNKTNLYFNRLMRIYRKFRDNSSDDIEKTISEMINSAVASLAYNQNRPLIYENEFLMQREVNAFQIQDFIMHTEKTWESRSDKEAISASDQLPIHVKVYAPKYLGHATLVRPYAKITEASSSYISLENLRLIKRFLLGEGINAKVTEEWRLRIDTDVIIANGMKQI